MFTPAKKIFTNCPYVFPRYSWQGIVKVERRTNQRLEINVSVACRIPATPIHSQIKNISPDGCMIEIASRSLEVGSTVLVELVVGWHVMGRVVWKGKKSVGIQFDESVHESVVEHLGVNPMAAVDLKISSRS